ncbi:hypothetical protein [Fictibacillus sp. NRS-1165]|uniref:hypothetical protein n=1 Tax=Fictibacillus sp. NRS-1165 TaxID=3144463 RepID=UPI003D26001B
MTQIIKLEGGNTRKSIATWNNHKEDFTDPTYILITRNDTDMIERGYFQQSNHEYSDGTSSVIAPSLVIRNHWGDELWIDGCNCGYGGEGPHGSEKILKDIGLPREIIHQVFYRHVYELERKQEEDGTYEFIGDGSSKYTDNPTLNKGHILIKDGNLIIQHKEKYSDLEDTIEFTKHYESHFLGSVKQCLIFASYDDVKEHGYTGFSTTMIGRRSLYKFILFGEDNRQIWLNPMFDGKTQLIDEPSVRIIMSALGYDLGATVHPKIEWIKKNILSIKPVNTTLTFHDETGGI